MRCAAVAVIAVVVMSTGWAFAAQPQAEATDEITKELVEALEAEYEPLPEGWERFDVQETKLRRDGRVAVALVYAKQPKGYPEVEADTTKVVRSCLQWLQRRGIDPADEKVTVNVSGVLPVKGETGKELVRYMGRSRYMGETDQIDFRREP